MPLAWNEIRHRAIKFANENAQAASEAGEKQTFWNEFFDVFGIARKTVASFEAPVKKLTGHDGAIDLFWPGNLIVEHKSLGGDLGKAQSQAFQYIHGLVNEGRHKEVPRYVIVSDFARIVLYDLEPDEQQDLPLFAGRRVQIVAEFNLADFYKNIRPFAFIAGYKQQKLDPEDPANLEAAGIMADLHDALKSGGYTGHELRQFLVRILFCLFAEDTGIFAQPRQFELYLANHTAEDGSDLGTKLARLFEVLDTQEDKRQKHLDADLAEFPYVNGDLFKEHLSFADFNKGMRDALLAACGFRWEKISPAVFGSLFQEVMEAPERRKLGAHYTAEKNIMKVVRSLFLDDLVTELEAIKTDKSTRRTARLDEFHKKLAGLTFFDPACGCGNFLVITYRELRALELEVLKLIYGKQTEMTLDTVNKLSLLDVDQMFGIELEEFPARIAEVALWLADHQANTELSIAFTQRYIRIPLRKSPHIHVGNALRMDWKQVLAPAKCSYILGNPPFVGQTYQSAEQKEEQRMVMANIDACGVIDYVANWHIKAGEYIQGSRCIVAFVSTNSICQGEQAGLLWTEMFQRYHVKIHFAHRTFAWESEARGTAHVHCVIVGFACFDRSGKKLHDYDADPDHAAVTSVSNISPYLVEGPDKAVTNRSEPFSDVPKMSWGNKPTDGGNFLLSPEEKAALLKEEPGAREYIRPYMGGYDFLNGEERYCLWLKDASPAQLRELPAVMKRVEAVRDFRNASKAPTTRAYAKYATLFRQIAQPNSDYLAVPEVSSERRPYIPIAFVSKKVICANTVQFVPKATVYHFGVLSSAIHMVWVRQVCGRLKSDYRYSNTLVYNNFPWPQTPTAEQKAAVEKAAQAVLDARGQFPDSTLADLYDPIAMPPALAKAHADLDRAVDRCYRKEPFPNDRARVEYLFKLYEQLTAPLVAAAAAKSKRSRKKSGPTPAPSSTAQSEGDSAHYYSFKEEPPTYG